MTNDDDRLPSPADMALNARLCDYFNQRMIHHLEREVRYLRHYGNKDCTAMADYAMICNEMEKS